jgi:hypothetical protein
MTRLYRQREFVVLVLLVVLVPGEQGEHGELPSPLGLVLLYSGLAALVPSPR